MNTYLPYVKEVNNQLNVMIRFRNLICTATKLKLYNAFILSHLQYCSTVWQFCSARNYDKLESLNKRALCIVFNDKVSSYQQLLRKSEASTLYNRRIQNMLITIYKCLNCNSFPKYLKDMFTLRQSVYSLRRANILSLFKPVTSTYGLNSFRYFASKNWNSLCFNMCVMEGDYSPSSDDSRAGELYSTTNLLSVTRYNYSYKLTHWHIDTLAYPSCFESVPQITVGLKPEICD